MGKIYIERIHRRGLAWHGVLRVYGLLAEKELYGGTAQSIGDLGSFCSFEIWPCHRSRDIRAPFYMLSSLASMNVAIMMGNEYVPPAIQVLSSIS